MRLIVCILIVANSVLSTSGRTLLPELPFQAPVNPGEKELVGTVPYLFSSKYNDSMPAQINNGGDQGQKVFRVTFSGEDVEAVFKYTDARGGAMTKMLKGKCYFIVSRFTYTEVIEGELIYVLSPESKSRIVKSLQIDGDNRSVDDGSLPSKAILSGALASLSIVEATDNPMCPDPDIDITIGQAALKYTEKSHILIRKGGKLNLEEKVFSGNDPEFNKVFCSWIWVLRIQDRQIYQALPVVDRMNDLLNSQAKPKG